jgi:hypothetical protein
MRGYIRYSVVILFLLTLLGCNGVIHLVGENKEPINVKSYNLLPIRISDLTCNLIPGTIIGGHYDGFAKAKHQDYFAPPDIKKFVAGKYVEILLEECLDAGYSVAPPYTERTSFTGSMEIILLGSVIDLNIKTFGEQAGDYTEVLLKINWDFYAGDNMAMIYNCKSVGKSYLSGNSIDPAVRIAFKYGVRDLLADSSMVNILTDYAEVNYVHQQISYIDKTGNSLKSD